MSAKAKAKGADAKDAGDGRRYQLVVWGATGFTGTLCVRYIAQKQFEAKQKAEQNEWSALKWAIGGRSASKLNAMKTAVEKELREDLKDQTVTVQAEVVLADSANAETLNAMVKDTRVIISTVGPFRQYGSPLVEACAKNQTHYVDTTGEHLWVKQQIDAHHQTCVENGTVIVPMCGYDSIPSDIGTFLLSSELKKQFGASAVLESVQHVAKAGGGAGASGGTLHTMLDIMEQVSNDRKGFGKLLANPHVLIPTEDQPTKSKKAGSEAEYPLPLKVVDGGGPGKPVWTAPFVMSVANSAVVRRSAYLLNKRDGKTSYGPDFAYFGERMNVKSLIGSIIFLVVLGFVAVLAQFGFIRNFARKYILPAQGEGPSKAKRKTAYFRSIFIGHGSVTNGGSTVPAHISASISGGDPGYDETAKMVTEAAMCLVASRNQLPTPTGGVLTPASAFGEVLLDRLKAPGGLKIEVLYAKTMDVANPIAK